MAYPKSQGNSINITEPGGSLDAENVCGLTGKFFGSASDLDRWPAKQT